MGEAAVEHKMTATEYLAFDDASDLKHEFIAGDVYAMSGGSAEHAAVKGNLSGACYTRLRGTPCRFVDSDLRLQAIDSESYFFADGALVCGPFEYSARHTDTLTNPTVIFEVLSPSTADYDRGTKFQHYRRMPSLQAYVLLDPLAQVAELRTRQPDGSWNLREITEGELPLACVDVSLPLAELFDLHNVRPDGG